MCIDWTFGWIGAGLSCNAPSSETRITDLNFADNAVILAESVLRNAFLSLSKAETSGFKSLLSQDKDLVHWNIEEFTLPVCCR